MNKLLRNSQGAAHLLAIGIVIIAAVVLYGGYRVVTANKDDKQASQNSKTVTKEDLQKADASLDDKSLDESLDPSQLDGDMQELL